MSLLATDAHRQDDDGSDRLAATDAARAAESRFQETLQQLTAQWQQTEEALRASEESYRTIFDSSNDAVFLHDLATGAVIDANRTACEVNGCTLDELKTRGVQLIGNGPPPFTPEKALEHIARAASGDAQRFEWCTYHQVTGEEMWVEVGLQRVTIRGEDRLLALVRDIRERKRAERALIASEAAYRTIFEHSSEGIWIHDVETGAQLDVNQAGCDLYGYTHEEMMALGHEALNFPDGEYTSERVVAYMVRALAGETPRFEWMGRHKNGGPVWGEVTLRRVTISGKDRILAVVRDIGERKQAEAALRRANEELEARVTERTEELAGANLALEEEIAEHEQAREQLRRSEEHFRRLIENSNDQLMICDKQGAITYIGPSVQRLLGFTPEEMIGKRPIDAVHPDDVPEVMATLERIMDNPGEVYAAAFRIRHKDGSWRVFENYGKTLSPYSADEGVVANGRDITERRRTEEALREATAAAERANRAKSEFLSRMSHELRTPMNSILGFSQVLEAAELPPRLEKSVQHILRAGRHLLRLINEVLEISRIEAGRHHLSLEPVRLGAVVQEAMGLARPLASQSRVELEYAGYSHQDDYVRADRQRLAQVLLNLLANAVKYNRADGRVRLSCAPVVAADGSERLRVYVEDTGRGIAREKQHELFTPFARLGAENSDIEGTGLGLALSLRLAEAMGGRLFLERSSAEGSVFCLELQRTQSPLEQIDEANPASRTRGVVPHEPATLLYIEDNLANLSLVETILWERPRWQTMPALQGQIGVDLAREHVPDLILLDLHLPDMRGEEVLRRLRTEPRTAGIPIVVISADATESVTQRLLAMGAAAFLTKPLEVSDFLSTLDRLLAIRSA